MGEIILNVSVVISTEQEHHTDELFALANKHGAKTSTSKDISRGVRYTFSFSNENSKDDFFNAIPIEWT